MKWFMLKSVGVHERVFRKRSVYRHTKDRILDGLYFRIRTPIDIRVDHNFLSNPFVVLLVANFFDDASPVSTHGHTKPDVRVLAFAYPFIAAVKRRSFDL